MKEMATDGRLPKLGLLKIRPRRPDNAPFLLAAGSPGDPAWRYSDAGPAGLWSVIAMIVSWPRGTQGGCRIPQMLHQRHDPCQPSFHVFFSHLNRFHNILSLQHLTDAALPFYPGVRRGGAGQDWCYWPVLSL